MRLRIDPAIIVEPYITGQTRHTVRVDTPQVGTNKYVRSQAGIRFGASDGQKDLFGEGSELVCGNHGRKLGNIEEWVKFF